jgi:hypothetical protein
LKLHTKTLKVSIKAAPGTLGSRSDSRLRALNYTHLVIISGEKSTFCDLLRPQVRKKRPHLKNAKYITTAIDSDQKLKALAV